MSLHTGRRLSADAFRDLKAEVLRAAVELSDDQLVDLTETLHGILRLRRPGRPISDPDGWVAAEDRGFG